MTPSNALAAARADALGRYAANGETDGGASTTLLEGGATAPLSNSPATTPTAKTDVVFSICVAVFSSSNRATSFSRRGDAFLASAGFDGLACFLRDSRESSGDGFRSALVASAFGFRRRHSAVPRNAGWKRDPLSNDTTHGEKSSSAKQTALRCRIMGVRYRDTGVRC